MVNKKQKFVFRASTLKKFAKIAEEQPTAMSLFVKLLMNALQEDRMFMGVEVHRGEYALRYKTEQIFFGCSKKRFRRDRFYLVENGMIETNRIGYITILKIVDYDVFTDYRSLGL